MFALDDLQLVLNAALSEDWTLEEGDEPLKRILVVEGRNVEVEVGVLGRGVRVGATTAVTWNRKKINSH